VLTFEIEVYKLNSEGELTPINLDKKELKSKDVLLITDDNSKTLWLWKGSKISVRKKFLCARAAVQLNSQKGLKFKSAAIEEGNEPEEFFNLFNKTNIRKSTSKKASNSSIRKSKKSKSETPPTSTDSITPPIKETIPPQETPPKTVNLVQENKESSNNLTLKMEELDDLFGKIPEGYDRGYVIIGTDIYGLVVSKSTFLGTETIDKSFQKLNDAKDGHFIIEGYLPRVIIKDNKVKAIELIKKPETRKEGDEVEDVKALKEEVLAEKDFMKTEDDETLVVYVNPLFK
jgi:hypothetical protein